MSDKTTRNYWQDLLFSNIRALLSRKHTPHHSVLSSSGKKKSDAQMVPTLCRSAVINAMPECSPTLRSHVDLISISELVPEFATSVKDSIEH